MSNRLSRFLHLEKDRGERGKSEPTSRLQGPERFEERTERRELPSMDVPEAHLERFKAQPPVALEAPAEAAEKDAPFPRCVVCESENGRYAQRCQLCGADLGTARQHEYNERHRRAWHEERQRRREALRTDTLQQLGAERREEAERHAVLLEKLREEEHRASRWTRSPRHRALVPLLLGRIRSAPVRWLAVAAWFGVALRLILDETGRTRLAGVFMVFAFIVLCVPGAGDRKR